MALYFFTYSTWVSRLGLYLEDLYISPDHRRKGVGRALLQHLAQIACEHRCRRFQWVVHRGNGNAIALYKSFGARTLDDWVLMSTPSMLYKPVHMSAIPAPGTAIEQRRPSPCRCTQPFGSVRVGIPRDAPTGSPV
jgi:hypothetical protein